MDWSGIVLVAASVGVAVAGIVAVTKAGINLGRRPKKSSRIPKAKGEFEPPEAPEGRYWG